MSEPRPITSAPERQTATSAALDQWRGLALVLVLISHGFYFTERTGGIGRAGVNLFFFISGVLVFRSLERSRAKSDLERTTKFWKRRLRRLWPALIAFVIVMFPVTWLLQHRPEIAFNQDVDHYLKSAPAVLGFVVNYIPKEVPQSLTHLWSVAVEMQFYLIAPIIYWLGGRSNLRRHLVWGFVLLVMLALGVMALKATDGRSKYYFQSAAWPMMLGFCFEFRRDLFKQLPRNFARFCAISGAVAIVGSIGLMLARPDSKNLVILLATGALVPCFIAYVHELDLPGPIGKLFAWIGMRTYSIYLWQQPLTLSTYLTNHLHPVGAILSILVGAIWFRFFERPFLGDARKHDVKSV